MINRNPAIFTEDDKQRLTEHLIDRVILGISGRDREDLVDTVPSRTIFAGVLQPAREVEIEAVQSGTTSGDAPAGTALGLDFRVRPLEHEGVVSLRIIPRWSHYYAVFPTWQQAIRATGIPPDKMDIPVQADVSPGLNGTLSTGNTLETRDDSTPIMDDVQVSDEPEDEEQSATSGFVVLPRVFRRHDVNPCAFTIDISQRHTLTLHTDTEALAPP